jgi:outer membrane protein W
MKKIFVVFLLTLAATAGYAQGTLGKGGKQLNAGLGFSSWGTPVYVGVDFGVHEAITVGPRISYRKYDDNFGGFKYSQTLTVISFNGNYHFNQLLQLPGPWDVYAGLTLGYYIWSDAEFENNGINGEAGEGSGLGLELQVGGRYFFSDNFGVNLELGGGTGSGGSIGITYKF